MAISHAANTPATVPAELGRAKKEAKNKKKKERIVKHLPAFPPVCEEGPCPMEDTRRAGMGRGAPSPRHVSRDG